MYKPQFFLHLLVLEPRGRLGGKVGSTRFSLVLEPRGRLGGKVRSTGFSLVLEPRGRLGGKVRSACKEFEDNKSGILSYISQSPVHPACLCQTVVVLHV